MIFEETIFIIINLTLVTFISSSVDNLMLLIGYMGHYSLYKKEVMLGYLIDIFIINIVALILSYSTQLFPTYFIRYLGIIPISLGIYQLFKIFKRSSSNESVAQLDLSYSKVKISLAVAGIMLANSGDTLAVILALMADTQKGLRWIVLITSLVMGLVLSIIARIFLATKYLQPIIHFISKYILPFILIFIGWYILTDSPTDSENLL